MGSESRHTGRGRGVWVCVRACMCAYVHACVRACVRLCVCGEREREGRERERERRRTKRANFLKGPDKIRVSSKKSFSFAKLSPANSVLLQVLKTI